MLPSLVPQGGVRANRASGCLPFAGQTILWLKAACKLIEQLSPPEARGDVILALERVTAGSSGPLGDVEKAKAAWAELVLELPDAAGSPLPGDQPAGDPVPAEVSPPSCR
jgi:hypothetical protein